MHALNFSSLIKCTTLNKSSPSTILTSPLDGRGKVHNLYSFVSNSTSSSTTINYLHVERLLMYEGCLKKRGHNSRFTSMWMQFSKQMSVSMLIAKLTLTGLPLPYVCSLNGHSCCRKAWEPVAFQLGCIIIHAIIGWEPEIRNSLDYGSRVVCNQ